MSVNIDWQINMSRHRFLTAAEAAAALGVRRATLYAYVSRGLLRSESDPSRRGRRYPMADVEALRRRVEARRDPPQAARGALDWGMPVLDSSVSLLAGGRLYYRGLDAVQLARRGESFERVAALLWLGALDAALPRPAPWRLTALPKLDPELKASRTWRPFARLQTWLPLAMAEDPAAYDLRPPAVVASGAWLLQLLAAIAAGSTRHLVVPAGAEPPCAASVLARAWAPAPEEAAAGSRTARLLDAALVLSADHELNVSAFTARCVASAGAPPQSAVAAALAALGGARHGGHCDRVEALFGEMASAPGVSAASPVAPGRVAMQARVRERLAGRLRRGEEIPGFGQPLYPDGDPRARLLLELAATSRFASPQAALATELAAAGLDLLGEHPNLDFGLVALARALELPPGAALALFAVGRTAGWIAHVLEQYADARLIRPRARYVGPDPRPAGQDPRAAPGDPSRQAVAGAE
jgi:citrate synthase